MYYRVWRKCICLVTIIKSFSRYIVFLKFMWRPPFLTFSHFADVRLATLHDTVPTFLPPSLHTQPANFLRADFLLSFLGQPSQEPLLPLAVHWWGRQRRSWRTPSILLSDSASPPPVPKRLRQRHRPYHCRSLWSC